MRATLRHPTRLVPLAFLIAIALGTVLLMLPIARAGDGSAPPMTALFTSTSAVCVTGLIVEDTPVYWSQFGQVVILVLFQIGGFGIMTGATLLGLLVTQRIRLRDQLVVQMETKTLGLGNVASVLRLVLVATVTVEVVIATILAIRFRFSYDETWGRALWHGLFHAVSAFNNAGFSTFSDNLMGFVVDPLIVIPVMVAIVLGGLGFPVLYELRRELRRPSRWSVHVKITVAATGLLLLGGFVAILWSEWTNPGTLGPFGAGDKMLASAFASVSARTAGFNTVDVGAFTSETILVHDMLMFIGGGSAGTAGGIKVTTFFLLAFVIWAEVRGDPDTTAFGRRIPIGAQRQALTVALLGIASVASGTLALLTLTDFELSEVLFEVVSTFATVGLSTGITADLPPAAQAVLITLMFIGRVGSITVATALALRAGKRLYRFPEERPIVG